MDNKDYITTYLPENSLIRQRHETARHGFLGFFKSEIRKNCDYIENTLKRFDDKQIPVVGGGLQYFVMASNDGAMRKAIRAILADQDDKTKWQEYDYVSSAAERIKKDYEERIKRKKELERQEIQRQQENPKF